MQLINKISILSKSEHFHSFVEIKIKESFTRNVKIESIWNFESEFKNVDLIIIDENFIQIENVSSSKINQSTEAPYIIITEIYSKVSASLYMREGAWAVSDLETLDEILVDFKYNSNTNISKPKSKKNMSVDNFDFLSLIFDKIPFSFTVKSVPDLKYVFVNKQFELSHNLDKSYIIGKDAQVVYNQSKASELYLEDSKVVESKEISINTYTDVWIENGLMKNKVLSVTRIPIFDKANSKVIYLLSVIRDITDEYVQDLELIKARTRLERMFNLSPIGILYLDADSKKIKNINYRVSKYLDLPKEEILNKTLTSLGVWDKTQASEFYNDLLNSGKLYGIKTIFKTPNGENKHINLSGDYMTFEDEELIVLMAFDITYQINSHHLIATNTQKQQELNKLKNTFVSMISHEFRTPLTTITLSNDLLRRYSEKLTQEEKNKHYDRIQSTVLKMTKLLENVLIIGKLESGQFTPNPEHIDLPSFCATLAENIEFNSNGSHIIMFNCEAYEYNTNVDENLIGLLLNNLLNNAVKYSPKDSVIEFNLSLNDKFEALFVVKDYGIGIPEEDQKNLFESFFRAKNVGPIDGYGLGLSLVKRCVEASKGTISFVSTVGEGTTFTVKIPTNLTAKDFNFAI